MCNAAGLFYKKALPVATRIDFVDYQLSHLTSPLDIIYIYNVFIPNYNKNHDHSCLCINNLSMLSNPYFI